MWEHVETTFNSKVQVLVNNAGLNPSAGWKPCIDVMLYGTMIGTFLARKKMGTSQVKLQFQLGMKLQNAYYIGN